MEFPLLRPSSLGETVSVMTIGGVLGASGAEAKGLRLISVLGGAGRKFRVTRGKDFEKPQREEEWYDRPRASLFSFSK